MLNRLLIVEYFEKIFNNLQNLDYVEIYNYISESRTTPIPDDMQKEVEEVYYRILLNENNKKIEIDTQIEIVTDFYNRFKEYLNSANKIDRVMNSKLFLMDLELPILSKFLKSRENVRTIRKGYR